MEHPPESPTITEARQWADAQARTSVRPPGELREVSTLALLDELSRRCHYLAVAGQLVHDGGTVSPVLHIHGDLCAVSGALCRADEAVRDAWHGQLRTLLAARRADQAESAIRPASAAEVQALQGC